MASDPFDFSDVFAEIENEIDKLMGEQSTIDVLKQTASSMVYKNVYPFYGSTEMAEAEAGKDHSRTNQYIRRLEDGGLADPDNYEVVKGRLELTIINNTRGNGNQPGEKWTSGFINDIIEEGEGYGWEHSDIYMDQPVPRPFMQETIDTFVDDILIPMIEMKCFGSKAGE